MSIVSTEKVHRHSSLSIEQAYAQLHACPEGPARIAATAELILAIFDDFYAELCEYPYRAKRAFETMDPQASVRISRERLGLYSKYIAQHGPRIQEVFPTLSDNQALWRELDQYFLPLIAERYEADIAFMFAHSLRRNVDHGLWRPVAYSFAPADEHRVRAPEAAYRRFRVERGIDAELIRQALRVPRLAGPFSDEQGDAERIAQRVNELVGGDVFGGVVPVALDIIDAGFFRDVSAFVVGRWVMPNNTVVPFVVALLNSSEGIYADAVLYRASDLHNVFSSALANLHVTNELYYQICVFLFSLMPRRPLGLHYSTIGFNHVGKVAILNEIVDQMRQSGQRLTFSPGYAGTVAIGFTFDACSYHLKVIRDRPTKSYKWGSFPGTDAVIEKYRNVHEINRAGSMLDNVMYFNMRLDRAMFEPELLDYICEQATQSVHVEGDSVFVRYLIAQLKIIPLPLYIETADERDLERAIINLGQCIRNNAATNIFNKDLDSRNYGVGRYGKVFLFDYDAVEELTQVKIRTNVGREPGEEAVPDWFFEKGIVFLPEEIESGLQIKNDRARRWFRTHNSDLLGVDYWLDVQKKVARGEVLKLQMYFESRRLP